MDFNWTPPPPLSHKKGESPRKKGKKASDDMADIQDVKWSKARAGRGWMSERWIKPPKKGGGCFLDHKIGVIFQVMFRVLSGS